MTNLYVKTFRSWWQKPKRIAAIEEERSISFLEIFNDLAYVVIVIQLTHSLVGHLSWENVIGYVGLYAAVWFAWVNGSLYHELHGNNDIRSRFFTFLQMFLLLWMAVFVHSALTPEGYQGFAFAYASFLATLTYLWWRTGVHDKDHRELSYPYTFAFLGTTLAILYSTQLPVAVAHQVWLGAIVFSLCVPFVLMNQKRNVSAEQIESAQRIRSSLVERFGLLTIILLGENLISIVTGATHIKYFTAELVATVSLSLMIVFALWWVYFDFISHRKPRQKTNTRLTWIYLHLPLTTSIGLTAVGLLNVIEHPDHFTHIDRWFVVGPVTLFLTVAMLLIKTLDVQKENFPLYEKGIIMSFVSAILLILLGISNASLLPTLGLTLLFLMLPVFGGFKVWIKRAAARKQSVQ